MLDLVILAAGAADLKKLKDIPREWLVWGAIALGAAILVVGLILLVRWRRRRAAGKGTSLPDHLGRAWKNFLRQIPWEFRRSILLYQPFVVFGEAGSGMSTVINKYTDWKGHAAKFYPSYTTDEALQVYLGTRALIQEVPPGLLNDTTQKARTALLKLWRPIFKKRDPIVVVCINAVALRQLTPEALRMQAQMIRGKVNIMSSVRGKPIETRIVLTHMDHIDGYLAFSQFLERHKIPLHVDVRAGIESALEPIEKYLPIALKTMPAKAYLKILTFLNKAPATFGFLAILLETLQQHDPLTHTPNIDELYLTSAKTGSPASVSNPLGVKTSDDDLLADESARVGHRRIATAIAAAGLAALTIGWVVERYEVEIARKALARYEETSESQYAEELRHAMARIGGVRVDDGAGSRLMVPRLFSGAHLRDLRARYVAALRDKVVLPALERSAEAANAPERTLYLLGLLYATRDGDLGRLILDQRVEWARALSIPESVVSDFVASSAAPWDGSVKLKPLQYQRRATAANDLQPWTAWFIELRETLAQPFLTKAQLAKLKSTANYLFDGLGEVRRQHASQRVHALLPFSTRIAGQEQFEPYLADLKIPDWLVANADGLDKLLGAIRATSVDVPAVEQASLAQLLHHFAAVSALADRAETVYRFPLGTGSFEFDLRRWSEIVERGKLRLLATSFMANEKDVVDRLFFWRSETYPDILMQPPGRGDFLFTGRGAITGRYTRTAYLTEVKPPVERFGAELDRLKLEADVKGDLATFVLRAVEKYAAEFETQSVRYYHAWDVRADSLGGALILLSTIRQPGSPFRQYLETIAENTRTTETQSLRAAPSETTATATAAAAGVAADAQPSPYLRPMEERLVPFRFIQRLLVAEKTKAPAIDEYLAILEQLQNELLGHADRDPAQRDEKKADPATQRPPEFEAELTPAARVAFNIVTGHRDSYERLVEAWLKSAGIEGTWRAPFLAPVREVRRLGTTDLETMAARSWQRRVTPLVSPLLAKFPFNPASQKEATPLEIDEALSVQGTYWRTFRSLIGPLCVEERGRFGPLPALPGSFAWPPGMFGFANQLALLTRTLWDKSGSPQPVNYSILGRQLPQPEVNRPAVVLAHITCGDAAVFAFNQTPAPQSFAWRWWEGLPAQVGVQIGDPSEKTGARYRTIAAPAESLWAFMRLLRRGEVLERNVWTWSLPSGPDYPAPKVKFAFADDPWNLFVISVPQESADAGKN